MSEPAVTRQWLLLRSPRFTRNRSQRRKQQVTATKTYGGERVPNGALWAYVEQDGHRRSLTPLTRHSGERLDYGAAGPGATNLALSILTDHRGRVSTASRCQAFALSFIEPLDRHQPWTISETEIEAWLTVVEDQDWDHPARV